jgi:hypothetical protein
MEHWNSYQRCAGQVIFMSRGPRPVASISSRPPVPVDQSLKQTRSHHAENFPLPCPSVPVIVKILPQPARPPLLQRGPARPRATREFFFHHRILFLISYAKVHYKFFNKKYNTKFICFLLNDCQPIE